MPTRPISITDFLTDGSLAALCEVASAMTGRAVRLHDADGSVIVRRDGAVRWAAQREAPAGSAAVATASLSAPLLVRDQIVGTLSVADAASADASQSRPPQEDVERFVTLLASIASEVCEHMLTERERADELRALLRLSSMLVAANDADETLRAAVSVACEVLGADAGTLRLLDTESGRLTLRASVGLSDAYIQEAAMLPASKALDDEELAGGVARLADLASDPHIVNPTAIRREGLRSLLSAGLVFRGRPLGVLRLYSRTPRKFTDAETNLLRSIAQHSAAAVANASLLETEAQHRRVLRQVQLAAEVQRRMFPGEAPSIHGVDVAARHISSFELSGDFYDLFDAEGKLGLLIGDVVGKGVAAALLMSSVRSSLRAFSERSSDLDEVMEQVNRAMCRDTLESEFATVFFGVLDPHTQRFAYCNGGHEFPLVIRKPPDNRPPRHADVDELSTGGMVIGVDPAQRYQSATCDLRPGDVLLAYTDGLADALNFENERFGKKRIREAALDVLRSNPQADAALIADHIIWENRRFVGLNKRTDDTTLVVVRVRE